MSRDYYLRQIKQLEDDFFKMGEDSLSLMTRSLQSLAHHDAELAKKVMEESDVMADREIELENKCIELLATQQPMASDLRFISTVLKILTDCRRFSRLAWDIGQITIRVGNEPLLPQINDICGMYRNVHSMVHDSFKAFRDRNVELAKSMSERDDVVDAQYDRIRRELINVMIKDPSSIDMASHMSFVARYMERAADHACSISSRTVYMITGERVSIR
ncbi:phosphate signaling complex protein PhoU [Methanocella sp. MCL-LM]|uniref:phosphate signaling complex protein PhoU n=1 Tax=Methanocella sp. MCL-LM TaxID=3412035 RepID=UPI003C78BAC4